MASGNHAPSETKDGQANTTIPSSKNRETENASKADEHRKSHGDDSNPEPSKNQETDKEEDASKANEDHKSDGDGSNLELQNDRHATLAEEDGDVDLNKSAKTGSLRKFSPDATSQSLKNQAGESNDVRDETNEPDRSGSKPIIDSDVSLGARCDYCGLMIYGTGNRCLSCADFYLCDTCMNDRDVSHETHRFLSFHENIHDKIHTRGPPSPSTEDAENTHVKDVEIEATYVVKTLYTYDYRDRDDGQVALIRSERPRPSPTSKRQEMWSDTKRKELPVVEKSWTIDTNMKPGSKATPYELQSYGTKNSTIEIDVNSPMTIHALRAIVDYFPGRDLWDGSLQAIEPPYDYLLLLHHRQQLLEYKDRHPESHDAEYVTECNSHIDEIVGFLDRECKELLEVEKKWGLGELMISFSQLWFLFRPGQSLYFRDGDQLDPYICWAWRIPETDRFVITAWNLDFDGTTFGRSRRVFTIKKFVGKMRITALKVFPARFYDEKESEDSLRKRRIESGKKFCQISRKASYMEYTGVTRDIPKEKYDRTRVVCDASSEPWSEYFRSRSTTAEMREYFRSLDIVADDENARKHIPQLGSFTSELTNQFQQCTCKNCKGPDFVEKPHRFADWDYIDRDKLDALTDDQYYLCSRLVYGYVLREREWHLLDVEHLIEPTFAEDAIEKLVLEEEKMKDMIKAICSNYTRRGRDDHYSADFIHGKGEGQIFLLHGPPGTGKTLTAECISEYIGRPLLALTTGDIGSHADEVEKNLQTFFKRGQDWNAVVLLDEADVYLGTRDEQNLERNSVISVFLREIDYYRGILFLTTNRVGGFDEAIISRIHFSLNFKKFDAPARWKIWKNNFDRLESERKDIGVHYHVLQYAQAELAKHDWNGREIRNAFQTAVTLAIYNASQKKKPAKAGLSPGERPITLEKEHLEDVVNMSNNFKHYISRTLDDSHTTIAKQRKLRDDTFGSEKSRRSQERGSLQHRGRAP